MSAWKATRSMRRPHDASLVRRVLRRWVVVGLVLATVPGFPQTDLQLNLTREVLEACGARAGLQQLPRLVWSMAQDDPRLDMLAPEERRKLEDTLEGRDRPRQYVSHNGG